MHSVHYLVLDVRGRLLSTKKGQESLEVIAQSDTSFLSAQRTSSVYVVVFTICFRTLKKKTTR